MRVLVVGGTGPTGPYVVEGLLERGHEVTVLHSGAHEVAFSAPIPHVHADPNAGESLTAALAGTHFDLAIAMYGRLSIVADALVGRCEHFFGVGAMFYQGWVDDVLHLRSAESGAGSVGSAEHANLIVPTDESVPFGARPGDRFSARAIAAEQKVMAYEREGRWRATMFRYARVYGPRQPGAVEWCVVRRLLDGRHAILVPDAGLLLQCRVFAPNAAAYLLAAVDRLDAAAGRVFNVADGRTLTLREWIETAAAAMQQQVEIVSIPLSAAALTFPYAKGPFVMGHRVFDVSAARNVLDVRDLVDPAEGIGRAVAWLLEHPPSPEEAAKLSDAFDYAAEDRLIDAAGRFEAELRGLAPAAYQYQHAYAHPPRLEDSGGAG